MLDMISCALGPYLSTLDLSIVRIDGSLTIQQRRCVLDQFNSDKSCVILLATIGAVGEGCVSHPRTRAFCTLVIQVSPLYVSRLISRKKS